MTRRWCDGLPLATVLPGELPKRVTMVVPYYENPDTLARQFAHWQTFDPALAAHLSVVVVDDGSPDAPAQDVVRTWPTQELVRLFRIEQDIPWNWLAARNIGAHVATTDWLLLTDIDHELPEATLKALVYGAHDPTTVYAFWRRDHTGQVIHAHSASFFMTRSLFWTIGGYDEALSGHYGTDGEYRRRVAQHAPIAVLTNELIRFEHVGDSSTRRYARKKPEDAQAVTRIVSSRSPTWTPRVLSFPYREVTA